MDLVSELSKSLQDYNSEAFTWVTKIIATSTLKVGLYIMGVLLLIELATMFEKMNNASNGIITVRMWTNVIMRFTFAGVMVSGSWAILQFVLLISNGLTKLIGANGGNSFDILTNMIPNLPTPSTDLLSNIGNIINLLLNPTGALTQAIGFLVLLLLGLIVQLIAYLMVWVIIYLRFFQMYMMYVMAPIPMASFASSEHKQIGINYIKRFGAYAFQSAIILIVMALYSIFTKATLALSIPTGGMMAIFSAATQLLAGIVQAVVFIVLIWQTLSASKSLFGIGV